MKIKAPQILGGIAALAYIFSDFLFVLILFFRCIYFSPETKERFVQLKNNSKDLGRQ